MNTWLSYKTLVPCPSSNRPKTNWLQMGLQDQKNKKLDGTINK